jgi:GGDEF domain-containing protein
MLVVEGLQPLPRALAPQVVDQRANGATTNHQCVSERADHRAPSKAQGRPLLQVQAPDQTLATPTRQAEKADEALYRAKGAGRNCVRV